MRLFRYSEPSFQLFGVKAGVRNLLGNRLRLGLKKSLGKITQPVNFYTRYPEYHHFFQSISSHVAHAGLGRARVLDIGSPKLFGMYLASRLPVDLECTDISPRNIDEYVVMWRSLAGGAPGAIDFTIMDARRLQQEPEAFDIVYSMSVIEHIEGARGDGDALLEMLRVLKPGGLLVFSVPVGPRHQEQLRPLAGADHVSDSGDRDSFFQRIYSPDTVRERLLEPIAGLAAEGTGVVVARRQGKLLDRYLRLGQNARGLLGMANPLLSALYNVDDPGSQLQPAGRYGARHRPDDIYNDYIHSCIKPVAAE